MEERGEEESQRAQEGEVSPSGKAHQTGSADWGKQVGAVDGVAQGATSVGREGAGLLGLRLGQGEQVSKEEK